MGTTPRAGTSGGGLGMFKAPPAGAPKGPPANPRGSMGRPPPGGAPAGPAMAPVNGLQSRTTPPPRPPMGPTPIPAGAPIPPGGGWVQPPQIPGQPQGSGLNWTVPQQQPGRDGLALLMSVFGRNSMPGLMGGRYKGLVGGSSKSGGSSYSTSNPGTGRSSSARGGGLY